MKIDFSIVNTYQSNGVVVLRKIISNYWIEQLANFLAVAKTQGYFQKDFDPNFTAQAIISLFEGSLLIAKAKKDIQPIENAKAMALNYLKTFTN